MAPDGEYHSIKNMANKMPEHAIRIAAVLTLIDNIKAPYVTEAHMAAGIKLAKHYANEALRLFGASSINVELQLAKRLLDWIKKSWPEPLISLPDIYQLNPIKPIRDKAMSNRIASILQEHGYLIPQPEGTIVGQRRKQVWLINHGT